MITTSSKSGSADLLKALLELMFLVLNKMKWNDLEYIKTLLTHVDSCMKNIYGPFATDSEVDSELKVILIVLLLL